MINRKPIVAHVNGIFFSRTETFIYNYLIKFSRIHPICISARALDNGNLFPFPHADLYTVSHLRFTPTWFLSIFFRLITGRWYEIEQILRQRGAGIIHAHFGPIGSMLVNSKMRLRLPLITNFYGVDLSPSTKTYGVLSNWRKSLFTFGDLFIVEGDHMRQRLIELGCPQEKITIQRIAIPVKTMPWRLRGKSSNYSPVLLFSGRFIEKKGLLYALAAVEILKKEGKIFKFRIIGDGPQLKQIKQYIDIHNMGSYTRLLGFLDYEDYIKEMNNADIYIQPSISAKNGDIEGGAPTAILEAQAMGIPIVSTYHCDIPNIVLPGQSALLVEERNISSLVKALGSLLENPSQWESMGRIGRNFVEQYHDIDLEVGTLEEKYLHLIA